MANFPLIPTTYYYQQVGGDIIDPALAAPTLLAAAKLGLGNANFTPGLTTAYSDFPLPAWTGYALSATVVWGLPVNQLNGGVNMLSPSHLFRATAVAVPEGVFGGFVSDGVAPPGTGILGSYKIVPTIPIQAPGDGLSVEVAWALGPNLTTAYANVSQ